MKNHPICCGLEMLLVYEEDYYACSRYGCNTILMGIDLICMQGSKPCCGTSATVWAGGNWRCSECNGVVTFNEKQLDLPILPKYASKPLKCECGADVVYGPNNGMHSATMPCPLYKKP